MFAERREIVSTVASPVIGGVYLPSLKPREFALPDVSVEPLRVFRLPDSTQVLKREIGDLIVVKARKVGPGVQQDELIRDVGSWIGAFLGSGIGVVGVKVGLW